MTPDSLHDLFVAAAGVAGALIGLLFVAISVEHERLTAPDADQVQRVRAAAALTAFTNALAVSLFALLPGSYLGATALSVSVLGLFFVAGSLLSLRRVGESQHVAMRDGLFLIGLVATFCFQLLYAVRLVVRAGDTGAAQGIGVTVIVCFLIGVARAWELIGGPSIGLSTEVRAIVQSHPHNGEPSGEAGQQPVRSGEEDQGPRVT